jgi:ParB family transcriptional regulator, chromosome partitioning protein
MAAEAPRVAEVDPKAVRKNPDNPRRFFNEASLDLLKTSIQEVSILVPLIVYADPGRGGHFVPMDGERRWRCALDLGLEEIPVNVIPPPDPLTNLLRMFNIHAMREQWPLVATALSLKQVIKLSQEDREARLSEITGLTRSTVRRAKRVMNLPYHEILLIQQEAHLDRAEQIHREDLYLEVEAAESVVRIAFPELAAKYPRPKIIRQFVKKREEGHLTAVTDFRFVGKLVSAAEKGAVGRAAIAGALERLIDDTALNPRQVYQDTAETALEQIALARKADLFIQSLDSLEGARLSAALRRSLTKLRERLNDLIGEG